MAAAVEMLKVPLLSPPVPQVSTILSRKRRACREYGSRVPPHDAGKAGEFCSVHRTRVQRLQQSNDFLCLDPAGEKLFHQGFGHEGGEDAACFHVLY